MEREFLKEYNLYSDLVRLNHYDYYQSSFTTPDTLEHFISIQHEDKKKIKPLCQFFFKNFKSSKNKDVYLILKWLITTHKIIQNITNPYLLEIFSTNINRMEYAICKENIENYFQLILINPYKQYLQKICQIKSQSLSLKTGKTTLSCNKENACEDSIEIDFMKINLLKYSLREFQKPCTELLGFFLKFYPFLCQFSTLIYQDLKIFQEQIKKQKQLEPFRDITEHEISLRQNSLDFLTKNDSHFLGTPIREIKVTTFFSSDPREKSEISSFL